MSVFQTIIVIISTLGLLGGIITVYVKNQIDIAKINVQLTFFQKDLDRKEQAILLLEKANKSEHENIANKIDELKTMIYEKHN